MYTSEDAIEFYLKEMKAQERGKDTIVLKATKAWLKDNPSSFIKAIEKICEYASSLNLDGVGSIVATAYMLGYSDGVMRAYWPTDTGDRADK